MKPLLNVVNYATQMHSASANPYRKDGRLPYITHTMATMKRLWRWNACGEDDYNLAVGVGHDLFEDCGLNKSTFIKAMMALPTYVASDHEFYVKTAHGIEELSFCPENLSDAEKKVAKDVYLQSFADKTIYSLCAKCADRLENTEDFLLTDKRYAGKYLQKAEVLFRIADARHEEIEIEFGNDCFKQIFEDRKKILLSLGT